MSASTPRVLPFFLFFFFFPLHRSGCAKHKRNQNRTNTKATRTNRRSSCETIGRMERRAGPRAPSAFKFIRAFRSSQFLPGRLVSSKACALPAGGAPPRASPRGRPSACSARAGTLRFRSGGRSAFRALCRAPRPRARRIAKTLNLRKRGARWRRRSKYGNGKNAGRFRGPHFRAARRRAPLIG